VEAGSVPPAPFTTTSIRPKASSVFEYASPTCAGSETSARTAVIFRAPPRSDAASLSADSPRLTRARRAPLSAKRAA
jgi:hypothetical protein